MFFLLLSRSVAVGAAAFSTRLSSVGLSFAISCACVIIIIYKWTLLIDGVSHEMTLQFSSSNFVSNGFDLSRSYLSRCDLSRFVRIWVFDVILSFVSFLAYISSAYIFRRQRHSVYFTSLMRVGHGSLPVLNEMLWTICEIIMAWSHFDGMARWYFVLSMMKHVFKPIQQYTSALGHRQYAFLCWMKIYYNLSSDCHINIFVKWVRYATCPPLLVRNLFFVVYVILASTRHGTFQSDNMNNGRIFYHWILQYAQSFFCHRTQRSTGQRKRYNRYYVAHCVTILTISIANACDL